MQEEEEDECGTQEECEEGLLIAELIAILVTVVSIGVCVMACQATSQAQDRLQRMSACQCVLWTMIGLTVVGVIETIALVADYLIHEPGEVAALIVTEAVWVGLNVYSLFIMQSYATALRINDPEIESMVCI